LDHPLEENVSGVNQVITEQHGERLVSHVHVSSQNGMSKTERILLPHVVHVRKMGRVNDFLESALVAFGFEQGF
jgi:hypothetical protein